MVPSEHIVEVISKDELKSLTLCYYPINRCNTQQLDAMFTALTKATVLEKVDLSHNSLRDNIAEKIASFLRQNSSLTSLDLDENIITERGAISIINAFKQNPRMKELSLKANPFHIEDIMNSDPNLQVEDNDGYGCTIKKRPAW